MAINPDQLDKTLTAEDSTTADTLEKQIDAFLLKSEPNQSVYTFDVSRNRPNARVVQELDRRYRAANWGGVLLKIESDYRESWSQLKIYRKGVKIG